MADDRNDSETQLIRSLKNGSVKAFDSIYKMYAKRLYAYSLQFTKSPEESEEIVHDIFVRLWMNQEKIRTGKRTKAITREYPIHKNVWPVCSFRSWLWLLFVFS